METQGISQELLAEFSVGVENLQSPDALPLELKTVICSDGCNLYDKTIAIAKASLLGLPFGDSCLQSGSSSSEISEYMRSYPRVARAIHYARACAKAWWIGMARKRAEQGDTKIIQFMLERTWPNDFSEVKSVTRRDIVPNSEFNSSPRGKIIDVKKLSDEELIALLDRDDQ